MILPLFSLSLPLSVLSHLHPLSFFSPLLYLPLYLSLVVFPFLSLFNLLSCPVFSYSVTLPFSSASKSSVAQCWKSSWWTLWCTPWSAPRPRNTLTQISEEPASCCGSTSPPSSSSLSCFSLQASRTWCCPYIRR